MILCILGVPPEHSFDVLFSTGFSDGEGGEVLTRWVSILLRDLYFFGFRADLDASGFDISSTVAPEDSRTKRRQLAPRTLPTMFPGNL